MNETEFVENIIAMLCAEHGDLVPTQFADLTPYIKEAFKHEGTIPEDELEELCMGEENEERRILEQKYPKLTRIFESIFDGDVPFQIEGI